MSCQVSNRPLIDIILMKEPLANIKMSLDINFNFPVFNDFSSFHHAIKIIKCLFVSKWLSND